MLLKGKADACHTTMHFNTHSSATVYRRFISELNPPAATR
jgi:hypothetical protein